jgi:hypothetical protein
MPLTPTSTNDGIVLTDLSVAITDILHQSQLAGFIALESILGSELKPVKIG